MGIFDTIIGYDVKCPKCGTLISELQTKDRGEESALNTFRRGDYFDTQLRFVEAHTSCDECSGWISVLINVNTDGKLGRIRKVVRSPLPKR